ncbi:DUF3386 family protein [Planctomicrobium piriforme]|nr:DUF3386 family protein [Planctomicrobium piriforme]
MLSFRFLRMLLVLTAINVSAAVLQAEERKPEQSAAALMQAEHAGRCVWKNFPGLSATLTISTDVARAQTTMQVTRDGVVQVQVPDGEEFKWVERALDSLVGHRLSDSEPVTNVEFADQQVDHPRGRLIRSVDPKEKSLWRVQGDTLTEVHRIGDQTRFIISVADVARNAEHKHLPQNFVVTTWENSSGQIKTVRQVHNEWTRVREFDLPARHTAITNRSDGTSVAHQIEFSDYKLFETTARAD